MVKEAVEEKVDDIEESVDKAKKKAAKKVDKAADAYGGWVRKNIKWIVIGGFGILALAVFGIAAG